jgi:hypothetical protein
MILLKKMALLFFFDMKRYLQQLSVEINQATLLLLLLLLLFFVRIT